MGWGKVTENLVMIFLFVLLRLLGLGLEELCLVNSYLREVIDGGVGFFKWLYKFWI